MGERLATHQNLFTANLELIVSEDGARKGGRAETG